MATKTFTTYQPSEENYIELSNHAGDSKTFKLNPSLPGPLILDFMAASGAEDQTKLAEMVNVVLDLAIVDEDKEAWKEFSTDPKNGVTVEVLAEVVNHAVSVMSGNPQDPE